MRDLENKLFKMISVSTNEAQRSPKDSGDWIRPGSFPYKCHHCGKRGHRIKDCFKKNRQGQKNEQGPEQIKHNSGQSENRKEKSTGKSRTTNVKQVKVDAESGLFISALVDSVPCDILVDTWATFIAR